MKRIFGLLLLSFAFLTAFSQSFHRYTGAPGGGEKLIFNAEGNSAEPYAIHTAKPPKEFKSQMPVFAPDTTLHYHNQFKGSFSNRTKTAVSL